MFAMLEYFLGFRDEDLKKISARAGKRFRPSLALFLADAYGSRKQTNSAALAIEIFHNFTLIHDDIVDRDEKRRGRPTVWKLWGNDHALNSGDALSLIAAQISLDAEKSGGNGMGRALLWSYVEVCKGQYLDFEMAGCPLYKISDKNYLDMIALKTGALVGVSAAAPGIAAKKAPAELRRLRVFGESLGIAYQIADDFRSVWSSEPKTGKDPLGDIRERKRNLPAVLAYKSLSGTAKARLTELYDLDRSLNADEVGEAKRLIDAAEIQKPIRAAIHRYATKAKRSVQSLSIAPMRKHTLERLVDELTDVA
jgi:geranylgeranyl diphosphate synthase type I